MTLSLECFISRVTICGCMPAHGKCTSLKNDLMEGNGGRYRYEFP